MNRVLILDIEKDPIKILEYKKNSKDFLLKVIIEENEEYVELDGYNAVMYMKLPNGKILNHPCEIIENEINVLFNEEIFSEEGKVYFEIELKNNIQKVTTFLTYFEII